MSDSVLSVQPRPQGAGPRPSRRLRSQPLRVDFVSAQQSSPIPLQLPRPRPAPRRAAPPPAQAPPSPAEVVRAQSPAALGVAGAAVAVLLRLVPEETRAAGPARPRPVLVAAVVCAIHLEALGQA